jgi:hypothetical protein
VKRADRVAQVRKHLPRKHKTLSSISGTTKEREIKEFSLQMYIQVMILSVYMHVPICIGIFMLYTDRYIWQGWGFSSVEEHMPGKYKALSSVSSTEKKKKDR